MWSRFLILVRSPESKFDTRSIEEAVDTLPDFKPLFISDRVSIWGQGPHQKLPRHQGIVLGRVFSGIPGTAPAKKLSPVEAHAILQSDGQSLIDSRWGAYVAVIVKAESGAITILRDPSYGQPCYQITCEGFTAYVSDVATANAARLIRPIFDWPAISHDLACPTVKSAGTGLWNVKEVMPGTAVAHTGRQYTVQTRWSPWAFTARSEQFDNRSDAVTALRRSVLTTAQTLSSTFQRGLLEMSGGLDSSILAAAFSEAGAHLSAINLSSGDGAGDETDYARLLAKALEIPLTQGDLADDLPVHVPKTFRPALDILQAANDAAIIRQAHVTAPDAFLSGAGGDNVFCFIKTAVPAVDALRGAGVGAFGHALHNLSLLHNCTLWRASHLALKSLIKPSLPALASDRTFLTGNYLTLPSEGHPWFPVTSAPLHGKVRHVLSLMSAQRFSDNLTRSVVAPMMFPLLCQPVIETALRIPTWMWIEGGRDRACARDAFTGLLPDMILNRRSKGNFMMFYARAFEAHRDTLQEQLNYGRLAEAGIIDRTAINAFMAKPLVARDATFLRLFQFAKVEAWMAAWAEPKV